MTKRAVSLSYEIGELTDACEGARILVDQIQYEQWKDEHDAELASRACSAVLALVCIRLRDLNRVIRGELDPAEILESHNQVCESDQESEEAPEDVLLEEWSSKKQKNHHQRELRRIARDTDIKD